MERNLIVSFRSSKVTIPLVEELTLEKVKSALVNTINSSNESIEINNQDIKILFKGKVLKDESNDLFSLLTQNSKKKKDIKLIAMGVSTSEAQQANQELKEGLRKGPRIRDDITEAGKLEIRRRMRLGRQTMNQVSKQSNKVQSVDEQYGFHRIETLPMLPDQKKARDILTELANDRGVLACMAKHKWHVGCLAELYPEGNVGESAVCVMGLNQNKGQKILLRIRTDDLSGFRKMLSIKKVLYHELAHNVHSEHDSNFFQLMRQIERECNEMDWTQGSGRTTGNNYRFMNNSTHDDDLDLNMSFIGGSGRLGGGEQNQSSSSTNNMSRRELAARAAMQRMTAEEEEIQLHCGCDQNLRNNITSQIPTTLMELNMNNNVKSNSEKSEK